MYKGKPAITSLVQICKAHQLKNVVISPGSRNAPLTVAFCEDDFFKCYSIKDERSAGFFALGLAQQSGQPSILICTSGSAALNYGPAVGEAFYQKLPLLVLTADRPNEWINQGIGQSMQQQNLYANFVLKSFELPQEPADEQALWYSDRLVNEAILMAVGTPSGPVQINIPLKEPLYEKLDEVKHQPKIIQQTKVDISLPATEVTALKSEWKACKKVMILTGMFRHSKQFNALLKQVAAFNQVVVLSETNANLYNTKYINCIDRTIALIEDDTDFVPDLLITFGHSVISKRVKKMLQSAAIKQHWHLDEGGQIYDTYKALTKIITCNADDLMQHIINFGSINSNYKKLWLGISDKAIKGHKAYLQSCSFSDLKVYEFVLDALPKNSVLHAANSTSVRYLQLFNHRNDLTYLANRGVSGIDGCTSTAVGYAVNSQKPVTLISGDIAFFYDVNGLWNDYLPPHFKIIIVNNNGGGIFRIIDGPATTNALDQYFETTHKTNAENVAKTYGLEYFSATNESDLKHNLEQLFSTKQAAILEVFTPRAKNDKVLKDYFKFLKP